MRHNKDFEVDGIKYNVSHYPATVGLDILEEILQVIGEPIGVIVGAGGMDSEITPQLLSQAAQALVRGMGKKKSSEVIKRVLSGVRCSDGEVNQVFDVHFAGRLGHLVKVVKEVVGFQYDDFLGLVGERFGAGALQTTG